MMRAIWKFEAPVGDHFAIEMPVDAEILTVQVQRGVPMIWALVSPGAPVAARKFRLVGTGSEIGDNERLRYVGSYQLMGGGIVFHLFEEIER